MTEKQRKAIRAMQVFMKARPAWQDWLLRTWAKRVGEK